MSYESPSLIILFYINGLVQCIQLACFTPFFSALKLLEGVMDVESAGSEKAAIESVILITKQNIIIQHSSIVVYAILVCIIAQFNKPFLRT